MPCLLTLNDVQGGSINISFRYQIGVGMGAVALDAAFLIAKQLINGVVFVERNQKAAFGERPEINVSKIEMTCARSEKISA